MAQMIVLALRNRVGPTADTHTHAFCILDREERLNGEMMSPTARLGYGVRLRVCSIIAPIALPARYEVPGL
jgi:hypothetical protein